MPAPASMSVVRAKQGSGRERSPAVLHRTGRSLPPHHAPGCGTPPAEPSPYRAPTECRVPGSGCSRPAGRLRPGGGGRSGMAGHAQAHGCVAPMATVRPVRASPDCAHGLAMPIAEERTHDHAQPFDRVPDRAGRPAPGGRRKPWPGRGTAVRPRRLALSGASATWRRPGSAGARGSAGDPVAGTMRRAAQRYAARMASVRYAAPARRLFGAPYARILRRARRAHRPGADRMTCRIGVDHPQNYRQA